MANSLYFYLTHTLHALVWNNVVLKSAKTQITFTLFVLIRRLQKRPVRRSRESNV